MKSMMKVLLVATIAVLCGIRPAAADQGNGYITFTSGPGSTGVRFEVLVNGQTLGPLSFSSQDSAEEVAITTAKWINAFNNSGLHANVDPNDPKKVRITGGLVSIGVRVLNGCIGADYHVDPDSPVMGSYLFTQCAAAGANCEGLPSSLTLFLNDLPIQYHLHPGMRMKPLLRRILRDLRKHGFKVALSRSGFQLYTLQMPDGTDIRDIGWQTDDEWLMQAAPVLLFEPIHQ